MESEKIVREIYEIRGYDFALCCAVNRMYDLEFGLNLFERLCGLVDLEVVIDRTKKTGGKIAQKKQGFKKWRGKISSLDNAYVSISEIKDYLTRISLVYKEKDKENFKEIKAILGGIVVRAKSNKTLLDCLVPLKKQEKLKELEERNQKKEGSEEQKPARFSPCLRYSSD